MALAESYDGPVTIEYDELNNTIRAFADPNSVNSICLDGRTDYYNLQGVRVENPANGVFIRVADGKSEKVFIR